jgi:exo-beta-1,3-glucanase (GH17 family)
VLCTVYTPPPPPPPPSTSCTEEATSSGPATVPTPYVTTFPSTGVYTIPAATITITSETTVVAATTTPLASGGSYTVGGVTTVVVTSTEVVVPVATTTSTPGGAVTSTLLTTTYTCPSSGTYTIAPLTTSVATSTVWVYPVTTSYPAGTYTQPATTITVTETVSPYICPYETSAPPPPPPATTSTVAAPPPPASTYSAPSAPSSTPSTPGVGNSGNHWALTYTPYTTSGACKTVDAVNSDVADIAAKGFKALRIYSTDCSGLQNVGNAAAAHGLKMILGVFIASSDLSDAQQQIQQISQWAKWSVVDLIVVGNESIQDGYVSGSQLAGLISQAKSAFKAAGYSGPVTTTEPLDSLQANTGALCGVVDVVGANIHPFFNSATVASSAGSFVSSQLDIVDSLCPGKKGYNLETGWPSAGNCNILACPGPALQHTAINGIISAAGDRSVILSYANDEWKAPGPYDVEQHWGAIQLFT